MSLSANGNICVGSVSTLIFLIMCWIFLLLCISAHIWGGGGKGYPWHVEVGSSWVKDRTHTTEVILNPLCYKRGPSHFFLFPFSFLWLLNIVNCTLLEVNIFIIIPELCLGIKLNYMATLCYF